MRLLEVKKPAKKASFEVMLASGMDSTLVHPCMQAAAAGRERAAAGLAQALITYIVALTSRQLLDEAALVEFAVKVLFSVRRAPVLCGKPFLRAD